MLYLPLGTIRRFVADHRGEHKVSGVLARHRGQPARASATAVSHGVSVPDNFAQYAGQRKRYATVADLCRPCPAPDWHGAPHVCRRALWTGSSSHGLRVRLHHHRPVSVGVRVGTVSLHQGGHQAALRIPVNVTGDSGIVTGVPVNVTGAGVARF